ncbi:MAG TPA: sigma-70 family RNA polymerase sigma factor [Acidimicrobiia bacterium]|nr:sigma-70 family RNA polymerase sigma factor [Acidimicrobiia bacterium]
MTTTTSLPNTDPSDLTDGELLELHRRFAYTRDAVLRAELINHYDAFAVRLGRRFVTNRETTDDLVQVARLALIQAVDRFDPARERPFIVFARMTIQGELKRHLRDHTWRIRPPRSLQDSYLLVVRTLDDLTHELRRSPTIPELAERAGLTPDEVIDAVDVMRSAPLSLDAPDRDGLLVDVGHNDTGFARVDDGMAVRSAIGALTEYEQRILRMRFEEQLSQAEIGHRIGRNQMYVSRVLARLEVRLKRRVEGGVP